MSQQPVLIDGQWRESAAEGSFQAENPATQACLPEKYPISSWADCEAALHAAHRAAQEMKSLSGDALAAFLDHYAANIESNSAALVEQANLETALPKKPRLADVELPRTVLQLRQAAAAAREGSWSLPTLDLKNNIRSFHGPLGPVCVFGPNNFPFAYNSISGGDFAAAIAAGNPVIGKANSSHPGVTRLFAELAQHSAQTTGMPAGSIQLLYRTSHANGERLVSDERVGATGYTGSRSAGLKLKAAADAAGKPIYLELSSVNPVVILPGSLRERAEEIANQFSGSCLMAVGQFCTNPGLVLLVAGQESEAFLQLVAEKFRTSPIGTLLSRGVAESLAKNVQTLVQAGAALVVGGTSGGGTGYSYSNTLLRTTGQRFLLNPAALQTEAFGNASLFVFAQNLDEAGKVIDALEGNLTGSIYSDGASDEPAYTEMAPKLRSKVGRLLNDKMPTGVAVSPAMNHGGPYPATGHPGFTAVGFPASLRRFSMLQCFDNVREARLPDCLRNRNAPNRPWRWVDGRLTQDDIAPVTE